MKSLLALVLLVLTFPAFAQSTFPTPASRVRRGSGAPSAGLCNTAAAVGQIYARQDAGAAGATLYVCANTGVATYAWEVSGSGAGGGSSTVDVAFDTEPEFDGTGTVITFTIELTGNVSDCTLTGLTAGQIVTFQITQDGTGGRTFACADMVNLGTVSGEADAMDTQTFVAVNGTTLTALSPMWCATCDPSVVVPEVASAPDGITSAGVFYFRTNHLPYFKLNGGAEVQVCTDGSSCAGGGGSGDFITLTDGATITWDADDGANAEVILGGNRTINISNLSEGTRYTLKVIQDATGTRGLTLGTGCTWRFAAGATTINPTDTAETIDLLEFIYDGTRCIAEFTLNYGTQAAPGSMISTTPGGSCSAKQTNTCNLSVSTSAGVVNVIAVSSNGQASAAGNVSSCTDSGGGTYTRVGASRVTATYGGLDYTLDMFYRANTSAGVTSVTCTPASGTNIIIASMWFAGANTSAPLINTNTWTGNTASGAASTLSSAMSVVANSYGGDAEDLCTGYTAGPLSRQDSGNITLEYKALGGAGTETPAAMSCGFVNFFTTGRIAIFQ